MSLQRTRARTRDRVAVAALLLAAVSVWMGLTAVPASAHAALVGTDPRDGAQLDAAPPVVTLIFNEPVEVPAGALRVFDADAQPVETSSVDTAAGERVAVGLPGDLPDGGYVVTYRVISTDAHPIGGVFSFTVGDAQAVDDTTVGALASGTGAGAAARVGTGLRGLGYLTTLLAGGAGLFAAVVARRPTDRMAVRRLAVRVAGVAIVVTALSVPVQAVVLVGGAVGAAWSPTVLGDVLGSTFGAGALARMAALLWLVVLWRSRIPAAVPAVAGLVAAASYALDGHQRSVDPTWLLMLGDVVHLAAGAIWFAGLVLVTMLLRSRDPADDPVEAAGLVARFSSLALGAFGAVAVGGAAMALPLVGGFAAATSTTYGWVLIAKTTLVAVVVLLAAHNRTRLVPAIVAGRIPAGASVDVAASGAEEAAGRSGAAWNRLVRTVRVEAGVLVVVLLITGALVTIPPASEAAGQGGLYETTAPLGDELEIDLVVDPNRVGLNSLHLYVLDPTGRPSSAVEDLTLELTYVPEGVGPIVVEPFAAGPGHWIATIDDLTFAGDWEIRVVAGIDRFTEASAVLTVPVAP